MIISEMLFESYIVDIMGGNKQIIRKTICSGKKFY